MNKIPNEIDNNLLFEDGLRFIRMGVGCLGSLFLFLYWWCLCGGESEEGFGLCNFVLVRCTCLYRNEWA